MRGMSPALKESLMTELRQRMIDAMVQRGLSPRTQCEYAA